MYVNHQKQRTEQTKKKLESVATELFGHKGFGGVSSQEIVARAGVTRGALYHHYNGKEGLFAAVVESSMRDLHRKLRRAALRAGDAISGLQSGIDMFLEIGVIRTNQQILFIDAPEVLGWEKWRKLDEKYALGMLVRGFEQAARTGQLKIQDPRITAHLLINAMIEAALLVSHAQDQTAAKSKVRQVLFAFVEGLR